MQPATYPSANQQWPALPLAQWEPTRATLHMWTQIAGKIRTRMMPPQNHYWHCTLYVTPTGLTTNTIPFSGGNFEMEFDFIEHTFLIRTSGGARRQVKLYSRSVADFYTECMARLRECGIDVRIWTKPQEVPDPIPFEKDEVHATYDPEHVTWFFQALRNCDCALRDAQWGFLGKQSPVHFFWGSFDLALTRFSGRRAPDRPELDRVMREAYSHEVASVGWWPGSGDVKDAAFYAYAAPEPAGFKAATIRPDAAAYNATLGEYLLMYEDVRKSSDPRQAILDFANSAFDSAATLGKWDPSLNRSRS